MLKGSDLLAAVALSFFMGFYIFAAITADRVVPKTLITDTRELCEEDLPRSQRCKQVWLPEEELKHEESTT